MQAATLFRHLVSQLIDGGPGAALARVHDVIAQATQSIVQVKRSRGFWNLAQFHAAAQCLWPELAPLLLALFVRCVDGVFNFTANITIQRVGKPCVQQHPGHQPFAP